MPDQAYRAGAGADYHLDPYRCITLYRAKQKRILWKVYRLMDKMVKPTNELMLFNLEAKNHQLPELVNTRLEDAYHELEMEFPVSISMFELLETEYRGEINANDLVNHIGQTVRMAGLFICDKTVPTTNNKIMWFNTFLVADGNFLDTTHFPNYTGYPLRGAGCYLIMGKVMADFGFPSIEVMKITKLPILGNPVMEND